MIAIKVGITKDGKPWTQYQTFGSTHTLAMNKFRVYGRNPGVNEKNMYDIGQFAIETLKRRAMAGIGSSDSPMPPLKKSSGGGIRDLWGPGDKGSGPWAKGHMLDNLSVRSVSASEVRMDFTTAWARGKARVNEIRAPWFGWSPKDVIKIIEFAKATLGDLADMFGFGMFKASGQIGKAPGGPLLSFKSAISSQIWMNPFAHHYPGSTDAAWAEKLRLRIRGGSIKPRRKAA